MPFKSRKREWNTKFHSHFVYSLKRLFEPFLFFKPSLVGVAFRSHEMITNIIRMLRTMLAITIIFFIVMLILVIRHIRKIVVEPLNKETGILSEYERNKDSEAASNLLDTIKTGNEIERLAHSFSSMVKELEYCDTYPVRYGSERFSGVFGSQ